MLCSCVTARVFAADSQEYLATDCAVAFPGFAAINCRSAPGTGKGHSWRVVNEVCHQRPLSSNSTSVALVACRNQTSDIVAAGTGYAPPAVAAITGPGKSSRTQGGDVIILTGTWVTLSQSCSSVCVSHAFGMFQVQTSVLIRLSCSWCSVKVLRM